MRRVALEIGKTRGGIGVFSSFSGNQIYLLFRFLSLDMKTDVSDFYDNGSHNKTGLFVRIPVIDKSNYKNAFEITFSMNKGTFFGDVREELKDSNYREVAKRFEDFINAKYRDTVSASYSC